MALLARWSPVIRGHGIPEAMEAILTKQSRISPSAAVAKPVSAAVAIGTGGPFGAEGPIIVTGGALGSLIGQALKMSAAERKILLASGAAAGMAATFGTPLAAVVLAIELLLFEFSTRVFVPLVVAAAVAGGMHTLFFGPGPLFSAPSHPSIGIVWLPLFAVLGLACGLLAALITKGLSVAEGLYERLPVPPFWFPVIGGALFGLVGLIDTRALGVGYDAIDDVLLGRLALGALVLLGTTKLVVWWIALASGTSGGTLAPLLLIGGCFGGGLGTIAAHAVPSLGISPGATALVAMGATFAAATRAPFASIVFVFELTRDFGIVLPLMLAVVVAVLVFDALLTESLMTEKLARRGLTVRSELHHDPLRTHRVAEAMTTDVVTVPAGATVAQARAVVGSRLHAAYPVVRDDGSLEGVVTSAAVLWPDGPDDAPVEELAVRDVPTVAPSAALLDVLAAMHDEGVEQIPVVEDGRLVGLCTRTDLLRVRSAQLSHERLEPGWLERRRSP